MLTTQRFLATACCFAVLSATASARDLHVGPGQPLDTPLDVPWGGLQPGDTVHIHWRAEPYRCKWVLACRGTAEQPIAIRGVAGPDGRQPVISGADAVTPRGMNFWSETRGVIKIGGSNVPPDTLPSYVIVEGLEIRSARPAYRFLGRNGVTQFDKNASAVFIEKGEHIVIRNCTLADCGNGLFASHAAKEVLIEGCHIYDNGIEGSIYEHNSYTEAHGITFQFNHYGPLRKGCPGNNLKDRSAGLVVRYNWIEAGNRQLDLVDAGSPELLSDPRYRHTVVYGNTLWETEGAGNSQIIHYGGDSGNTDRYRKGTLYLYHNTIVSTRDGNTALVRLSSAGESADIRNNVIYTTAPGRHLAILSGEGSAELRRNWLKENWRPSRENPSGAIVAEGNLTGEQPGFRDFEQRLLAPAADSPLISAAIDLAPVCSPHHVPKWSFSPHTDRTERTDFSSDEQPDLGAFASE